MGRVFAQLDEKQARWLEQQPVFFVATAPLAADGHVNVSPKGARGSFRVLGPTTVAYLDLIGSGIETVAHLRENGRIVLMFCAFSGPPNILRLHGQGRVVTEGDEGFGDLLRGFDVRPEVSATLRSVVVVEVTRIADSCGFVAPRMEVVEERDQLFRWAEHRERADGAGWKAAYERTNNRASIDGLPGLDVADDVSDAERARYASEGRVI